MFSNIVWEIVLYVKGGNKWTSDTNIFDKSPNDESFKNIGESGNTKGFYSKHYRTYTLVFVKIRIIILKNIYLDNVWNRI